MPSPTMTAAEWLKARPASEFWVAAIIAVLFYHLVWSGRIRVWPLRKRYIPNDALIELSNYKYKSGMSSWLDINVMNPLWSWTAERFVPDWAAPNAITTVSLLHAVVTFLGMLYFAPTLVGAAPRWVYVVAVWNLWMYQLLDALDGKQARRMEASSPLGQLFDHGCDAICCFLMGFMVSIALQTGSSFSTVSIFYLHIVPFFISNWEEVQTGMMRFGVLGVTEAQFLVMGLLLASGVFGPEIFQTRVYNDWTASHVFVIVSSFAVLFTLYDSFSYVNAYNKKHGIDPAAGRWQVGQFVVMLALGGAWFYFSADSVFAHNPVLMLFPIGLMFAFLVSRLIVHKTTKMKFDKVYEIVWPLPFLVANAAARFYGVRAWIFPMDEWVVAWAYFAFVMVVYCHFVSGAIQEICSFLKIRVFHLPSAEERARKRSARLAAESAAKAVAPVDAPKPMPSF